MQQLTVQQFAEINKVSVTTVYNWIKAGKDSKGNKVTVQQVGKIKLILIN